MAARPEGAARPEPTGTPPASAGTQPASADTQPAPASKQPEPVGTHAEPAGTPPEPDRPHRGVSLPGQPGPILRHAQGVLIGDHGRQRNVFRVNLPRSVRIALLSTLALVVLVGAGVLTVTWVLPQFAPTYKTEFLIDTTAAGTAEGVATIADSLRKVVDNSGDSDALALRRFGGECGAQDNTSQLVGFGTGNRQEITDAVGNIGQGAQATLQRGIVEAVADFSKPFARRAKQVNRIIVVTRNGTDACDSDTAFVQQQISSRIRAAGLAIEFRMIGYQVRDDQQEQLTQLATGTGAPEPMFVDTPGQLDAALDWFTNIEPVLRNAKEIVDILNPAVEQVNSAVAAVGTGRLDTAERTLDRARAAIASTDTEFEDLQGRAKNATARDIHARASRLRAQQQRVVKSADDLVGTARSGTPLGPKHAAFERVATDYNNEVKAMNEALAALRAKAPRSTR
ncbi:VWA domain-containing protein [Micromonospora sp. WMMD1102]|uniref:VWA domain-containing protein n=1 Tax=Micromonospora sp. WMMD1102 TaxID=3016105 RepID=UPI0024153D60|nr:VWA domain-containing protein [Micromonospora sp. WMMD1102]MDG4789175.1 VWA domain-containing protein [Micromonospora sp. WMMD1102]